jgi:hypothetical protein
MSHNVVLMSSTFPPELRWFLGNVMRGLLVALALTPIVSALAVTASSPLEGWSGSAFEDYLGWMLLSLPFIVILGSPVLVVVLVAIRIGPPSRSLAIALAVVIGDGLFALLLTRPWDRESGPDTVALTVLTYLPLWFTYGAIVRLPEGPARIERLARD